MTRSSPVLSRHVALFSVIAGLGGCAGPDYGMYGTVKAASCLPADGRPEPVAGARVALSCPQKPDLLVAVTDAKGRFGVAAQAATMTVDPACALVVEKEGYVSRRYPLMEVCWDSPAGTRARDANNHPYCQLLGASAMLVREPAAKEGAR